MRKPDFERNLLRILNCEKPERATLFDLMICHEHLEKLCGRKIVQNDRIGRIRGGIDGFCAAGYDYATLEAPTITDFSYEGGPHHFRQTVSLNDSIQLTDWESFEKHPWKNPAECDFSVLDYVKEYLPEGMKIMIMGPGGVLENVTALVGYDNMCYMLYDEPELIEAIFERVGELQFKYYQQVVDWDYVGILCYNDDWGFNTQTALAPNSLRKLVFPWAKKIVDLAHAKGKKCILHSCGYFNDVINDVIEDMCFDGRHSYEDNICPVEKAYNQFENRIAVLGGIDMDFITRKTPVEIERRALAMLEKTREKGGYALGTGNSVPNYVPFENYQAMLNAAWNFR